MKKTPVLFTIFLILMLFAVSPILAKVGVGVGTGRIEVDEMLRPGLTYKLPPITVFNTGDERTKYTVSLDYSAEATEIRPPEEWFYFTPRDFYLEPDQQQVVQVEMKLPVRGVEIGDYFVFLSAQADNEKSNEPGTSIGVAAATRLYFTVEPANIFQAILNRITSLHEQYHPWSTIGISTLVAGFMVYRFRKKFQITPVAKARDEKKDKQK